MLLIFDIFCWQINKNETIFTGKLVENLYECKHINKNKSGQQQQHREQCGLFASVFAFGFRRRRCVRCVCGVCWLTVRYDAGGHALVLYRLLPLELGDTLRRDSVGMELFSCGVLLLALTLTGESHLRFKTHNLIYFAI